MTELSLRESDTLVLNLPDVAVGAVSPDFVRAYLDATAIVEARHEFGWIDWELEVEEVRRGFLIRVVAIRRMDDTELEYKRERTVSNLVKAQRDALKGVVELVKKELAILKRLIIFKALVEKELATLVGGGQRE